MAAKRLVISLRDDDRRELRIWFRNSVRGDGRCDAPARAPTTWPDAVRCAIATLSTVDVAWIRAWTVRWVREDGSLAIPTPHQALSGAYPQQVTFGRRER
jgi:hypothetical protein